MNDSPEPARGQAIDQVRQDVLDQTRLSFLPRRQVRFLKDYAHLPGSTRMRARDRIKLIPDDYRRKFLRRVEVVVQHSIQAEVDAVSEFNWEADAWRDIFGRLRDDERLRMDKREYNYKATVLDRDDVGNDSQRLYYKGKRIPDITFGLSSYSYGDPQDEGIDERERRIRRSLSKPRLSSCIWDSLGRSLVVDGKWGNSTILFPFSVYEAKKNRNSEIDVKIQLKLAFNTYLQMMDRLVRQPDDAEKYQQPQAPAFSIFGFTSSGSTWRMYVGYLPNAVKDDNPRAEADDPLCDEDSHMRLIWWGNVYKREEAGELLDMVDQIHEYAVTTHRPFVATHLEGRQESIHLNQNLFRLGLSHLSPSLPLAQDLESDWFEIETGGSDVRKSIRDQRKRKWDAPLTDDEQRRHRLEARLQAWERERPSLPGIDDQPGAKPRKVVACKTRQQPLRRAKAVVLP